MTVFHPSDGHIESHGTAGWPDPSSGSEPQPQDDPIAERLRRQRLALSAAAVVLLAGVMWSACYLTVLTGADGGTIPPGRTAERVPDPAHGPAYRSAFDPWGPHPLQAETRQAAALLRGLARDARQLAQWHDPASPAAMPAAAAAATPPAKSLEKPPATPPAKLPSAPAITSAAGSPEPAAPDPAIRRLVDKGWPALRPAASHVAIPAVVQAVGIAGEVAATPQRAMP
ncbi:hypothetical protein [Azospirillum picis]|uniref:Uncharacterized protein n=1 Tax=Azospirillum picis TaxID=488438 RepID=A0ABU0MK18_9PROT|nr:hypothetical protein [Azospirillum picis]MBP2299832.1 hypothetical protein [Azospirillum picis]MDQ0533628.1 hypothetical protein [Azospirillum picis]